MCEATQTQIGSCFEDLFAAFADKIIKIKEKHADDMAETEETLEQLQNLESTVKNVLSKMQEALKN